ncbi:DinB family protein [Dactylosporangium sp. NPDC049140]|uniref:DinB family protein n=1 Tax=Dactylosporangium sp. NPDC049140 TaxID=3155647 RepID=UPI0033EE212C
MVTFSESDDLRGARFIGADLSGAVLRGVDLQGVEIESPWLFDAGNTLIVNGVDVLPYVDAELDRRFPGRAERRAADPDGLRAAWTAVEQTWTATLARAAAMPTGTVDASVQGEWSFAQTLRHLVHATDIWFGRTILELEDPFHPAGLRYDSPVQPTALSYAEILEVRSGRVAMVRDYLAEATPEILAEPRRNPHAPEKSVTVLSALHVILGEEWEHHRYAVRDLDALQTS